MDKIVVETNVKKNSPPNKGVIAINLFEISNAFIKTVQTEIKNESWIEEVLPEYVLVDGEIHNTTDYFDDVEFCIEAIKDDNKKWSMFDVEYTHPIFEYEIDSFGFSEFASEIQLADYLKKIKPHSENRFSKNYYHGYSTFVLIQIDVISHYDYYNGGYECETIMQILGHFDSDFNLVKNDI